jgi:hypothetical protein
MFSSEHEYEFKKLMDVDSVGTYAAYIVRFVLVLLRFITDACPSAETPATFSRHSSHSTTVSQDIWTEQPVKFPFFLTPLQKLRCIQFLESLQLPENTSNLAEIRQTALHMLLFAMLSEYHESVGEGRFNCTITRFIMLLQITQDFKWKAVKDFSTSIAGLQWCTRAIFLFQIIWKADMLRQKQNKKASNYVE